MNTYKMYLVLGDWSDDGHGKTEKVLLESNVPVKDVQEAYKKSCKLTNVGFDHERGHEDHKIAVEYEDSRLSKTVFDILAKYGLTFEKLNEWSEDDLGKEKFPIWIGREMFVKLWIWFVQIGNPKIEFKQVEDTVPVINGYWDDNLNAGFGYGLYT